MPDMIMALVSLLVAAALYAWAGVTLGTVFRALGGAPWKAWLPLVSQVEMLRLAKRPGWHLLLLAVPLYGLVVYYQVLRELTRLFGRPARLALIGVVLLPVWAGAVTGGASKKAAASDEATTGPLGVDALFGLASQPQPAYPGMTGPPSPVGEVPGYGAPAPHVVPHHHPATVYPEPAIPLEGATVVTPAVALPVQPVAAQPAPGVFELPLAAQPSPVWEIEQVAQVPDQAAVPQPEPEPGPPSVVVMAEPVVVPVIPPAAVPSPEPAMEPHGAGGSALRPVPSALEVSDHTVVIDRSRLWSLVLEDGRTFDVWASSVVVGRERTATDDGVQMLTIPDSTRTISKRHARFDLVDGTWQVTDLGSTNGIVVTGADGRIFSVRSGGTSVVGIRLVLGSVEMRLVPRASLARSA